MRGRRAHRLEPDPTTAPWVRWIFQQRATGRSVAGIAREPDVRGVPCPSGADQARNPHRMDRADRSRDPGESPLHRTTSMANRHSTTTAPTTPPRSQPWCGAINPTDTGRCQRKSPIPRSLTTRRSLLCRACERLGRPQTATPGPTASRARSLRRVPATHGLALGQQPIWLPLPPWPRQRTNTSTGGRQKCVHQGRQPAHRTPGPTGRAHRRHRHNPGRLPSIKRTSAASGNVDRVIGLSDF